MRLHAYIDESGPLLKTQAAERPRPKARIGTLAAVAAPQEQWQRFAAALDGIRRDFGIPADHEIKANDPMGPRAHGPGARADDVREAVAEALAAVGGAVAIGVRADAKVMYDPGWLRQGRVRALDASGSVTRLRVYELCLQDLLQRIAMWGMDHEAVVSVRIDEHNCFGGKSQSCLSDIERHYTWLVEQGHCWYVDLSEHLEHNLQVYRSHEHPGFTASDFVAAAFYHWCRELYPPPYAPLAHLVRRSRKSGLANGHGVIGVPTNHRFDDEEVERMLQAAAAASSREDA